MGSLILKTEEGEKFPFEFSSGLTVASIVSSLLCIYIGLIISSRDRAYSKSKQDIAEMTLSDTSNMTIKEIKETNLVFLALYKDPTHLIIGGCVTAAGIVMMHYVGMMAMVFEGSITWNAGYVVLSVIIGMIASMLAFWVLFRLLALYPYNESFRMGGSIVMTI
jgi:NO-binding membrane sensor protein with MHYT domain